MIARLIAWLRALLARLQPQSVVETPCVAPEPVDEPSKEASKPRRQRRESIAPLREMILDELDEYFLCMRRFRAYAPDDYDLFSRIGAAILTRNEVEIYRGSPEKIADFKPVSWGAFFIHQNPDDNGGDISASFMCFRKMERCARVITLPNHTTYQITIVYDARNRPRGLKGYAFAFHVGVAEDGTVKLLREGRYESVPLPKKSGKGGGVFYRLTWDYPYELRSHDAIRRKFAKSPEDFAVTWFSAIYYESQKAAEGFTITAAKGTERAAFAVDLADAKRVFADRSVSARTPSGAKKRIFHAVREHERETADGKTKVIRAHYRGLRVFDWNGYAVRILWPGQAKAVLRSDGPGAFDLSAVPNEPVVGLTSAEVGRLVARALRAAPKGREA